MKLATRLILYACTLSAAASVRAAGSDAMSPETQSPAAAERTLEESLYDLSDSVRIFACSADGEPLPETDGEPVVIEGQLYERFSLILDGAGGYHYSLNTMPVGLRGTGEWSGEEFRVSEENRGVANQRLAGGTGTYRQELKMVGRDTHRTFSLVATGSYTVSADGHVIVSRSALNIECRVQDND
jgi:hypothetical protein